MEEIDIKEIVFILLKKKVFIILTTLICALVAFLSFTILNVITENKQEKENLYYAETHFIVGTAETTSTQFEQNITDSTVPVTITERNRITQTDALFKTYSELIKSKTSLEKVIDTLELDTNSNSLARSISLSQISESNLLSLTVAYKDKEKVVQIADKLVLEFINNMEKAYSTDEVTIIDKAYLLENVDLASSSNVQAITPLHINNTPKFTIIAAVIGFILSVGLVLLKESLDDTIKNETMLEQISNSKNIISIEKNRKDNTNQFALLKLKLSGMKTILVSSPEKNKDISYISNNLAYMLAKANNKVLLLELNSDDYMLVKKYDYKALLTSLQKDNKKITKLTTKSSNELYDILYINQNIDNYLDEKQLKDFISALENVYDSIVINIDNLLDNACAFAMSKAVRNTLIVTTERSTKIVDFSKVNESLKNIKGIVFVKKENE